MPVVRATKYFVCITAILAYIQLFARVLFISNMHLSVPTGTLRSNDKIRGLRSYRKPLEIFTTTINPNYTCRFSSYRAVNILHLGYKN
jgi:hypothetical protein